MGTALDLFTRFVAHIRRDFSRALGHRGFVAAHARLSAVVAIVGAADAPLVFMATRWFRGVHPVAPEMDASMRLVLIVAVVSFSAFFARLMAFRRRQVGLLEAIAALEMQQVNADDGEPTV